MESMVKVLSDGSPMVRYEVMMALSNFVEKYLQAFLVVAEDAARVSDVDDQNSNEAERTGLFKDDKPRVVPLPRGVNQLIMERFEKCWKALRKIQHNDPHPKVSEASNIIVRVVHETLLDMRVENEAKEAKMTGLSEIREEGEMGSEGMERAASDIHLAISSPDSRDSDSRPVPNNDGLSSRLPNVKIYPLRRSASETAGGHFPSADRGGSAGVPPMPLRNPISRVRAENLLPKSEFFQWKKSIFQPDYDDVEQEESEDRDPLNLVGAARNYQSRRNVSVKEEGTRLASRFVGLKPRVETTKKSLDMLLEDEEDNEERDESLKSDLRLREKRLLQNTSEVKMTSMLKFHSYENALVVCDNEDHISVWDYEKGNRRASFTNGNPDGSRMTTSLWINESSSSLFFVGCDDGSARIWKGMVQDNGEIAKQPPSLASSFFAAPDMVAGQTGRSGLICEWQQMTGTLIAGGL
mmetsp:Transcript_11780/g.18886  ORF Transcript_11780/g.18886 Transcript_11780/m.18886 type:complete len:467 (+) Transcript_11780:109-1509(+)